MLFSTPARGFLLRPGQTRLVTREHRRHDDDHHHHDHDDHHKHEERENVVREVEEREVLEERRVVRRIGRHVRRRCRRHHHRRHHRHHHRDHHHRDHHHDHHHHDNHHHDHRNRRRGSIDVRKFETIRVVADNRFISETPVVLSLFISDEHGRAIGRLARIKLLPGESFSKSFRVPGQRLSIVAHALRRRDRRLRDRDRLVRENRIVREERLVRGFDIIDVAVYGHK
ncbi:hypothetical protein ACFQZE_18240 [Paenibacillus sp. GCM10027627]